MSSTVETRQPPIQTTAVGAGAWTLIVLAIAASLGMLLVVAINNAPLLPPGFEGGDSMGLITNYSLPQPPRLSQQFTLIRAVAMAHHG
jgi:hypothetical protein